MKLSLQDKIALIYSLTGSQRKTAEFIGISHQKVGRLLRIGQEGGYLESSKVLKDYALNSAINTAFEIHKEISKQVAKDHNIPFNPQIPIYYERKPLENGVLGDRVVADHIHWISDELKAKFLLAAQKTDKFVNASLGSVVNWVIYKNRADDRQKTKRGRRTKAAIINKTTVEKHIEKQVVTGLVYTPYTAMSSNFPQDALIDDLFTNLDQRHSTAAQGPNTALGKTLLLQVDTRRSKDGTSKDQRFRAKHPYKAKPKK